MKELQSTQAREIFSNKLNTNRNRHAMKFSDCDGVFDGLFTRAASIFGEIRENSSDPERAAAVPIMKSLEVFLRHTFGSYETLRSGQSYFTWLTFRPGLEAFLMIGKWLDDLTNYQIWLGRIEHPERYQRAFWGPNIISSSLPRSKKIHSILTQLNGNFVHPNLHYTYRTSKSVFSHEMPSYLDQQVFDCDIQILSAHILAYLNLLDILVRELSEVLTKGVVDGKAHSIVPLATHWKNRAKDLAIENTLSKKILQDFGLWEV